MDVNTLYNEHTTYFLMAAISTILYLVKIFLCLIGSDHTDYTDHSSTTGSFKIWTLQALLAFGMGMGWMGLATTSGWMLSLTKSLLISFSFGFAMLLLDTYLFTKLLQLNRNPKENPKDWIGSIGQVYVHIPARGEGLGQVIFSINGKQRTLQALTKGERIESFSLVKIIGLDSENLVVEKVG